MFLKTKNLILMFAMMLILVSCNKNVKHFNEAYTLFNKGVGLMNQRLSVAAAEKFADALLEINKCDAQDSITLSLKAQIEDNYGSMCWKNELFTEAIDLHKDAAEIFKNLNDTASYAIAIRKCGRVANSMGNKKLAKQYYEEALNIANALNNNKISSDIYLEYGRDILMETQKYDKAIDYISRAMQLGADSTLCQMALGITYYYIFDDKNAEIYLLKALKSDKAGVKMSSYQTLSVIEQSKKNLSKSIEYQQLFTENLIAAEQEKNIDKIQKIKSEYDLKMQKMQLESSQKIWLLILIISATTIIIVFLVTIYFSRRKVFKKQIEVEQMKKRINDVMKRNKVYVTALALSEKISSETLNFTLSDNDWNDFIQMVDAVETDFSKTLLNLYPTLANNDLRICCLVRLGFNNKVISVLVGMNCAALARRKWRIKQDKMNGDNENRNFDEIINQLSINNL